MGAASTKGVTDLHMELGDLNHEVVKELDTTKPFLIAVIQFCYPCHPVAGSCFCFTVQANFQRLYQLI